MHALRCRLGPAGSSKTFQPSDVGGARNGPFFGGGSGFRVFVTLALNPHCWCLGSRRFCRPKPYSPACVWELQGSCEMRWRQHHASEPTPRPRPSRVGVNIGNSTSRERPRQQVARKQRGGSLVCGTFQTTSTPPAETDSDVNRTEAGVGSGASMFCSKHNHFGNRLLQASLLGSPNARSNGRSASAHRLLKHSLRKRAAGLPAALPRQTPDPMNVARLAISALPD